MSDYGIITLFFFGIILVEFAAVMLLNDGVFTYALDDPYIHLAVAENLANTGLYGVNPSEVSAPCSSPLWPFLMVPFAGLQWFEYAPLLLNTAAGFLTCMILIGRVRRIIPPVPDDWKGTLLRAALVGGALIATNVIGVVFTGMEHSLQVLLAVCVVEGMLRHTEGRKPGAWFEIAVVIGPWVRYENLALTLAAVIFLFMSGQRGKALLLGSAALAGLAAFSAYLYSLGLSPIPASITAKSTFEGQQPFIAALRNLKTSMGLGRGMLIALSVSLLFGIALASRGTRIWRLTACCIALAGSLHLVAGAYGWVNRYEIYILISMMLGLAGLVPKALEDSGIRPGRRLGWVMLPLFATVGFPYIQGLAMVPMASNNIYTQHFQMHRFVVSHWRKPVAVNDLGYVCFRNSQYVLDLWGLASPKALSARLKNEHPDWISELSEEHGVKLAMVYTPWFPSRPASWRRVATLNISGKLVTPAWHEVSFYATEPRYIPEILDALSNFNETLPDGAVLKTFAE